MNISMFTKCNCLLFLFFICVTNTTLAQHLHQCGFQHELEELQSKYPQEYQQEDDFERWISDEIQARRADPSRAVDGVVEIPVVVHVIHSGEPVGTGSNISDAQVYSQITSTNEDFRRTPGSRGFNSHPEGADTEIQFCLAQVDPDGNPTTGINRVDLGVSEWNRDVFNSSGKPSTQWNPDEYANFWVVESFEPLANGFILLGYAQFPSGSGLPGLSGGAADTDGIVMIASTFGSADSDDGTFNLRPDIYGRTTTHEIGHWLGLRHIWGDGGCSVDDYCDDTPRASAPNYSCSAGNSCNDTAYGWPNNPADMVENYMDYSGDECMSTFTNDQKERMRTVLDNSPRRASLLNVDKCSGAPIIAFSVSEREICPKSFVTFSDESLSSPTSWSWTFPGGQPSSSTEQYPEVYYENLGNYTVTLTATNDLGMNSLTKTSFINVDNSSLSRTLYRDFALGLTEWEVENPDGAMTWEVENVSGLGGVITAAVSMQNRDYTAIGQRDGLITPTFSLYGRDEASLEIGYAYRKRTNVDSDSLIIYLSLDDGVTYPYRLYANGDDGTGSFATNTTTSSNFTPTFELDWCYTGNYGSGCIELDLSAYQGEETMKIKLENYNNNGNNLYIKNFILSASCVDPTVAPLASISASAQSGCNTLSTTFGVEDIVGNVETWSWSFPGGTPATSTMSNPTVTYDAVGTYPVSVTIGNPGGSTLVEWEEMISLEDQSPTASFDLVTSWGTVVFDNQSQAGNEYLWDFGDGNSSIEANPTHNYGTIGENYTVTLTVTNACGSDVSTQTVQTTSIDNPFGENTSFNVYPNPNQGDFVIEVIGKNNSEAKISIYDILGRTILQSTDIIGTQNWTKDISLDGQSTGTYVIRIDIDGLSSYKKIVLR